jgi:chromosome segregation ATPase
MVDTDPDPWPLVEEFYGQLCKHLGTSNRIAHLVDENRTLGEEVKSLEVELQIIRQDRETLQGDLESASERVGDLERKCRGLEGQLERALRAAEEQKTLAIVSFLAEMADVRANQLLFKVLDRKRAGETLKRLAVFLRDKGVEFVHTKGEQFELTDSIQHDYILKEQATLPCRVEVIARGIRMHDCWIVRPQVQVVS